MIQWRRIIEDKYEIQGGMVDHITMTYVEVSGGTLYTWD